MERDHDLTEPIELGVASTDTLGGPVGTIPEPQGLYFAGLSDE